MPISLVPSVPDAPPPEPSYEDQRESEELAQTVTKRYQDGINNQQTSFEEMEEARQFYSGNQWIRFQNGRWIPAPSPAWRVRLTINKLPPLVELLISTFLRYRPLITANPFTDEDIDKKSAKIAEILLRYYWQHLKFDVELVDLLTWVFTCGNAFLRVRWDQSKGRKIPVYEQVPSFGPDGSVSMVDTENVVDRVPEGGAVIDVISPFSMSIEPGAQKFHDAAWCVVVEILRKDVVEQMFGVPLTDADATTEGIATPYLLNNNGMIPQKDRVAVYQMYERPTQKHPEGRLVYVANNKVLNGDGKGEPLPGGEIRITHFTAIRIPGELLASSHVSQVIPLQKELNRGRSQLIENRNLTSRPQGICALGAINKDDWNNKPGNLLEYDPVLARGNEPKYMTPPSPPGYVMSLIQLAEQDMMDLASRHEVKQGQSGSNVNSGKQAAIYAAADDSRLIPAVRIFEQNLRDIGKYLLAESQEGMKGEQILTIVGHNRQAEIHKFMANEVSADCNISFEIASQLSMDRESMRTLVRELNAQGKMDDETMWELLEIPTVQRVYENEQDHRLNAELENEALSQAYFPPLPTDNHVVHLKVHENYINLPENRGNLIAEMMAAGQSGAEPLPQSLQSRLQHMEEHRKQIAPTAPPPPAPKVNLSIDRLLQIPAIIQNPQVLAQLMPYVIEMIGKGIGEQPTPSNQPPADAVRARFPGGSGIPEPMPGEVGMDAAQESSAPMMPGGDIGG